MPAALSPLRYIQLARCVIQWWVDTAPMLAARRKAAQERAARLVYAPRLRALAAPSVAQMMLPEEQYQKVAAATAAQDRPASAAAITSALASPYLSTPDISLPPSNLPLSLPPRPRPDEGHDEIYRLMNDPRAFLPGAMQAPKEIVVLCHGKSRTRPPPPCASWGQPWGIRATSPHVFGWQRGARFRRNRTTH